MEVNLSVSTDHNGDVPKKSVPHRWYETLTIVCRFYVLREFEGYNPKPQTSHLILRSHLRKWVRPDILIVNNGSSCSDRTNKQDAGNVWRCH